MSQYDYSPAVSNAALMLAPTRKKRGKKKKIKLKRKRKRNPVMKQTSNSAAPSDAP